MSQPTPYVPSTSFIPFTNIGYVPGQQLDIEFNDLATTLNEILANLAALQRDDLHLVNGSVDIPQLAPNVLAALSAAGIAAATAAVSSLTVGAPPTSAAAWTSLATSFTGDITKMISRIQYNLVSGTPTPTSGSTPYAFRPELTPAVSYMLNQAGANFDTADNGGRTGVANQATYSVQFGQGDHFGHYFNMTVESARSGATSWTATPNITAVGGAFFSTVGGAFISPISWVVQDQGFDVAYVGEITTGNRTNDTGALGALWVGHWPQSSGTKAWDAFYFGSGKTKIGADYTQITTNPSGTWTNAVITIKSLDRIYLNATPGTNSFATGTGTDFIYHNGSGIITVSGNVTALQVYPTEVVVNSVPLLASNVINALYATATPAAASATAAVTIGSALVGIYAGTGSPSGALTAPKGSIYTRTDGSSGSTRLYVNTDAGTTWTNVTTAA